MALRAHGSTQLEGTMARKCPFCARIGEDAARSRRGGGGGDLLHHGGWTNEHGQVTITWRYTDSTRRST